VTTPRSSTTAQVTALVEAHVREIVEAAERAARELEQEIEAASIQRATEVRGEAERDAAAIRAGAEAEARALVDEHRRRSATWAAERIARMEELSEGLLTGGEAIRLRLPEAEELQRRLSELVTALTTAARAVAAEAARPQGEPG
jgi:hypothetical protein